jgi:hypothetical protein
MDGGDADADRYLWRSKVKSSPNSQDYYGNDARHTNQCGVAGCLWSLDSEQIVFSDCELMTGPLLLLLLCPHVFMSHFKNALKISFMYGTM